MKENVFESYLPFSLPTNLSPPLPPSLPLPLIPSYLSPSNLSIQYQSNSKQSAPRRSCGKKCLKYPHPRNSKRW